MFSRGMIPDRNRLYWDEFERIRSTLAPPDEQAAIVRYLARRERGIRCCIQPPQRPIELLNECRTRLIGDVATGKLDVREAVPTVSDADALHGENADVISSQAAAAHPKGLSAPSSAADARA